MISWFGYFTYYLKSFVSQFKQFVKLKTCIRLKLKLFMNVNDKITHTHTYTHVLHDKIKPYISSCVVSHWYITGLTLWKLSLFTYPLLIWSFYQYLTLPRLFWSYRPVGVSSLTPSKIVLTVWGLPLDGPLDVVSLTSRPRGIHRSNTQ